MKNEGKTTSKIEQQTKRVPSLGFLLLALGAVAGSAALMLSGQRRWALFVGQWVPSLLILGTYNKIAKTFSAPYDEEQRRRHGGFPASMQAPVGAKAGEEPFRGP